MSQYPAVESVANRALRTIGVPRRIGNIDDGSEASNQVLEFYGPTLRQLLRAAHWSLARKMSPGLTLLGDSTGQTASVSSWVEPPWRYAYAWPIDSVAIRWVPWSTATPASLAAPVGNIPLPGTSGTLVPNLNAGFYPFLRPARFLLSTTDQYPTVVGNNPVPDFTQVEGVGPISRRIILTNVQNAMCVYTYLALDPSIWDDLFEQGFVATLAACLAPGLIADKKEALAQRNAQIMIAKQIVKNARAASANEAGWPQRTDREPDWLRIRRSGRGLWNYGLGAGPGYDFCGWDSMAFADGSTF